ncbi:type 4a pilus biogenesis protein PilO [candidate division KSB1 bacterium]|nr:type 4a pilus biogenesis protein PilO [candidate division KSB1 bacterium]
MIFLISQQLKIDTLHNDLDGIKKDIKITQEKIIFKHDLPAAIKKIKNSGSKFGLKFQQIIPDYPSLINSKEKEQEANAGLLRLTVHFKLQGYYKSFGKFLSSLDKLPFYMSLGEVTIVYNDNIHPQVGILFDGVLFLYDKSNSEI